MLASCLTAPLRLSFFALVLLAAPLVAWGQDEYEIGPVPQWVTPFSVDFDAAPPADQASGGIYYLLLDDQVRVTDGGPDVYSRYVLKVLDDEGIQQAAQFAVDFDPSYQRLTLHAVRVRRGGAYHDRLRPENVSVLRRETDLEQQIYDGRKTANVILDEVRVGDVVEYSYTVSGANPIFDGRYAHGFYTEYPVPVHHFRHRLLWPAGRTLHTKAHGAAPEPTRSRQGGFIEYRWEQNEVAARISDGDTPAWYEPYAWVQVSEWGAWRDVVRWAEPMYAPRPSAVRAQAAEIVQRDSSAEGQLLAALRFAQEEIRYLGFEMGRGSHEPRPPDVVLEQRFGDCKDKSRLLISLLQALGIEAYPAFVHTRWYDALAEWLPTPFAFNHVIVVAHLDGERYWLDPTQRHQRGLLPYLSQPDYGQALVVRPGTTGLVAVDPPRREGPDKEVRETFHLAERDGEPTTYSVRTVFYGASADAMRGTLARQSRQELAKGYLNYYASAYPGIEATDPISIHDDEELNRILVNEHYTIPDFWEDAEAEGQTRAEFYASETSSLFYRPSTPIRTMPLALGHPYHQVHTIEVHLPEPWPIESEAVHVEDEALAFSAEVAYAREVLTLTYTYRTKADHVAPERAAEYLKNIDAIEDNLGYQIFQYADANGAAAGLNWPLLLLALFTLAISAHFARKVYRYEPSGEPLAPAERDPRYQGLGGWLILVGLGVVVRPFVILATGAQVLLAVDPVSWNALTSPASAMYHPLWAPTLLFEVVINSALLVFAVLVAVLYFQRRFSFPRVFSIFLAASATVIVLDTALSASIPAAELTPRDYTSTVREVVGSLIWIAYLHMSKRVESTFVRRRTSDGQTSEETSVPPTADVHAVS